MTRKSLYIALLVLILAFTLYEEISLRPYLFRHHLTAFYIAGSLPNFLEMLVLFFGYNVIKYPLPLRDNLRAITSFGIGLIFYELAQPFMPQRTFDVADIVATVLGGLLCAAIAWWLPATPKVPAGQ